MRIALDAKRYFFNRTGLGNYARRWVQILAQRSSGNDILLCTPKIPQPQPILPPQCSLMSPEHGSLLYREWFISRQLNRKSVNLYHGLSNELPFSSGSMRCRKLVSIHDLIFKRYPGFYPVADRTIYDLKSRYACRHADLIIATSQTTAADIQTFYHIAAARIRVVYQDVAPEFFLLQEQNLPRLMDEPYFLFVSSFTGRKNHALLIEALESIQRQTNHHLVLAGAQGPTLEICRRLAQSLGLSARVHFFPDISQQALMQLYRHADGFLLPSAFEGFGIPLAEAMAAGIPAAASDISVFREIGQDACIYFRQGERDAAAEAMLRLLMPEQRARLLPMMRERAPLFSADALWNDMKTVYGLT
ncbi:MAG: glycosyltransferase family 4 protein [Bacteroidetes bacterium]|nr:glycosyltransferase family 4 protein [Bacteroidota bacterium]